MNRGVVQSSPVQQLMAAGSPNWWNINNSTRPMLPPPHQPSPPYFSAPQLAPPLLSSWHDHNQELPAESWSQLLMGGFVVEEDKSAGLSHMQQVKKLENWEEQFLNHQQQHGAPIGSMNHHDIKQENSSNNYHLFRSNDNINAEFQAATEHTWPQMMPVSSPKSCVTSLGTNMLDFSNNKADGRHPLPDRSSECNSTAIGGAAKKARVQPSSSTSQTTFKVRKEKLGDRITAIHQLVSPFGKTDTASVLLEAIGYIRFLQSQIEALSLPYIGSGSRNNMRQQQQSVQGERNCLFPEDPGQLVNDNNCLKRKAPDQVNTRQQTERDQKTKDKESGTIEQIFQVVKQEGWTRLYSGLAPSLFGTAASQGVYYYFYQIFRNKAEITALERRKRGLGDGTVGMFSSLIVAAMSGCVNVLLTNPIWVVVTRMQTHRKKFQPQQTDSISADDRILAVLEAPPYGTNHAIQELYDEAGLWGFWKGVLPTLIMVSNPSLQFMIYETLLKKLKQKRALSKKANKGVTAFEIFLLGALAKLGATVVTYPLLVVKARLQVKQVTDGDKKRHYKGTVDAIMKMIRYEGISGCYKGMRTKIVQSVLAAAVLFMIKEELVNGARWLLTKDAIKTARLKAS